VLSGEAEAQNRAAAEKLAALNKAKNDANAALSDIKSTEDFIETIVAAQNDDRAAFDNLAKLARDASSPYAERAQHAWTTIFDQHSTGMYQSGFKIGWKEGFDPSKLSWPI
jgi:Tfp pilus assembly protein PilX